MGLATVQVLWLFEICEILVISLNLYWVRGSMEVVSPFFQRTDDCKKFSVIDVIVLFSRV